MRRPLPTYDYECLACGYNFERRQRFEDKPVAACPKCEAGSRRAFHSVPILFKGNGFYCTDNGRALRDAQSSPDDGSGTKAEAKADAKPKATSEAQSGTQTAAVSEDGG